MSDFPRLILRNKAIEAVKRFHPWIFSGAVKQVPEGIVAGDFVDIYSDSGNYLATGQYNGGNIAVKIFSFQPISSIYALFFEKLQQAYCLRQNLGLTDNSATNCYRLVNAEGDGMPGAIIDYYNGTVVLQAHSLGIYRQREIIVDCLQQIYGERLRTVYDKSAAVLNNLQLENLGSQPSQNSFADRYLFGAKQNTEIREYGHRFSINWETGQKTGFFLDQRENRLLLSKYVQQKRVLNTFCYSGGFSIYALQAGATTVHSVDSSGKAMELMTENLALNFPNNADSLNHQAFSADVFTFLKESQDEYDVVILDPPAFAKSLSARHQAMMAYRRLNQQALMKVARGGILFTFSCSQVVTPEHFSGAITAAAIDSGRTIRILHHLRQPADHPISIYHPEGLYLKGLVLSVD
jgi:23S rRNA (cytosine1962-C5)-methyltransferase